MFKKLKVIHETDILCECAFEQAEMTINDKRSKKEWLLKYNGTDVGNGCYFVSITIKHRTLRMIVFDAKLSFRKHNKQLYGWRISLTLAEFKLYILICLEYQLDQVFKSKEVPV